MDTTIPNSHRRHRVPRQWRYADRPARLTLFAAGVIVAALVFVGLVLSLLIL